MLIVFAIISLAMVAGGIFLYHYRELKYFKAEHDLDIALGVIGLSGLVAVCIATIVLTHELVTLRSLDERIAVCEEYAEELQQSDWSSDHAFDVEQDYHEVLKRICMLKEQRTKESEYRWWLYFGSAEVESKPG